MRFCTYCGQPLDPVTQECPVCGGYKTQDLSDKFVEALKSKFRSPLMLIMCILSTASVLMSMFNSDYFWMNLLSLTLPIAMWIVYFSACTSKPEMPLGGFRFASAIITILRTLIWIVLAVMLVVSIIIISVPALISQVISYAVFVMPEYEAILEVINDSAVGIGIIMLIFVIFSGLLNIFFVGCISRSIKSIIESFKHSENCLRKLKGVTVWLIITGVIGCIYVFNTLSWNSALSVVTVFVGALLAGKIAKTSSD